MGFKDDVIMFRGAPVVTIENTSSDFVAYIMVKMWVDMPKSCGVITGIAICKYPTVIRLPEGI